MAFTLCLFIPCVPGFGPREIRASGCFSRIVNGGSFHRSLPERWGRGEFTAEWFGCPGSRTFAVSEAVHIHQFPHSLVQSLHTQPVHRQISAQRIKRLG